MWIVKKDNRYFYINENHGRFTNIKNKAYVFICKSEAKKVFIQINGEIEELI